jgi:hypothetical protein
MTSERDRAPASVEVDHVFVCCGVGAPEAEALLRLGLAEGPPNTHPGQGTACRRFPFPSAYLELIWVRDADEARSPLSAPTRLLERWTHRGRAACPFAVIFRPVAGAPEPRPPFATWPYHPRYLPPGMAIEIASDTALAEPELFYLPFASATRLLQSERTPGAPPLGRLESVDVALPGTPALSPAARAAEAAGLVSFSSGETYLMTLTFAAAPSESRDLRPDLPLVLRW